jgi:hypothetical protein
MPKKTYKLKLYFAVPYLGLTKIFYVMEFATEFPSPVLVGLNVLLRPYRVNQVILAFQFCKVTKTNY